MSLETVSTLFDWLSTVSIDVITGDSTGWANEPLLSLTGSVDGTATDESDVLTLSATGALATNITGCLKTWGTAATGSATDESDWLALSVAGASAITVSGWTKISGATATGPASDESCESSADEFPAPTCVAFVFNITKPLTVVDLRCAQLKRITLTIKYDIFMFFFSQKNKNNDPFLVYL